MPIGRPKTIDKEAKELKRLLFGNKLTIKQLQEATGLSRYSLLRRLKSDELSLDCSYEIINGRAVKFYKQTEPDLKYAVEVWVGNYKALLRLVGGFQEDFEELKKLAVPEITLKYYPMDDWDIPAKYFTAILKKFNASIRKHGAEKFIIKWATLKAEERHARVMRQAKDLIAVLKDL